MQNYRTFEVKYLSPTNTKGARVKILDRRRGGTVTIPFDYEIDGIYNMAEKYLKDERNIDIIGLSEMNHSYLMFTDNFETLIK